MDKVLSIIDSILQNTSLLSMLIYVVLLFILFIYGRVSLYSYKRKMSSTQKERLYMDLVLNQIIKKFRLSGQSAAEFDWYQVLSELLRKNHDIIPPYVHYALTFKNKEELLQKIIIYDYTTLYENKSKKIDRAISKLANGSMCATVIIFFAFFMLVFIEYNYISENGGSEEVNHAYWAILLFFIIVIMLVYGIYFLITIDKTDIYTTTRKYIVKQVDDRLRSYEKGMYLLYTGNQDDIFEDVVEFHKKRNYTSNKAKGTKDDVGRKHA